MRRPQKGKSRWSVVGISAEIFVFILVIEITDVMGKQRLITLTNKRNRSYALLFRLFVYWQE
jgi:hypothetical protein